jgi:hypothetical protein
MNDGLKILLGTLGGAIVILLFVSDFSGGGMMGTMGSMMSGSRSKSTSVSSGKESWLCWRFQAGIGLTSAGYHKRSRG